MKKELFPFFQKVNVAQGSSLSNDYLKLISASWRTAQGCHCDRVQVIYPKKIFSTRKVQSCKASEPDFTGEEEVVVFDHLVRATDSEVENEPEQEDEDSDDDSLAGVNEVFT
ncbi:hypothetical protein E8E14_000308 [Neopestalotiopsis sp. 37M]|nr:hypothetical protein E8E14_000308 [Neopestalotiopsis sp. 37M]